jgi:hypothetical protein
MTTKPETKFWKRIKNNASKITYFRIEAVTPLGLPDLNGLFNDPEKGHGEFWIELKVTTGKRVNLSPAQISWHMHRSKLGGKSFIMATPLVRGAISVYSGGRTLSLAQSGMDLEPCALFPEPIDWSGLETWFIDNVA